MSFPLHLSRSSWWLIAMLAIAAMLFLLFFSAPALGQSPAADAATAATSPSVPLLFVENCGQVVGSAAYYTRTGALDAFFSEDAIVLSLQTAATLSQHSSLRLTPIDASSTIRLEARDEATTRVNIYRNRSERYEGLRTYGSLVYREIYPGIDLVYRGQGSKLKADWIVQPGNDIARIGLAYGGAHHLEVHEGALWIETPLGLLIEDEPILYQEIEGERRAVEGGFRLLGDGGVGFWTGDYDPSQPLVIDPSFEWSTYLGGSGQDEGRSIAVDGTGAVYVAGYTQSIDFPVTPGAFDVTPNAEDVFIAKFDPAGSLLYATYLGGAKAEREISIAIDPFGNLAFAGGTSSTDFPVTPGSFGQTMNYHTGFVGKLDSSGALLFAAYLGGKDYDAVNGIAVDTLGAIYLAGYTDSEDFPVTVGAFDTTLGDVGDGFAAKVDPTGSQLVYATFLGADIRHPTAREAAYDIAVDSSGNAYVLGIPGEGFPTTSGAFDTTWHRSKLYVTKLDPTFSSLVYSTFLGGTGDIPDGRKVEVNDAGEAYVLGETSSDDFPVTPGAYDTTNNRVDGFLTRFDATGSSLVFSTFLGAGNNERFSDFALDRATGISYVTGTTLSVPPVFTRHWTILALVDATGSYLHALKFICESELNNADRPHLTIDASGTVYLTGRTYSSTFPVTPGAFDSTFNGERDAYAIKLRPGPFLLLHGTPAAGQTVHYTVEATPSSETGTMAQVMLSCSGRGLLPLPGGVFLPLIFDSCTQIGIQMGTSLQGTVDAMGRARTPDLVFPAVSPGIRVYSAVATWDLNTLKATSASREIEFVTQ
ncbi:MAG: SBBP repeat-containing protein [Planctomycetota bacterium]